jgi:hypothetical protein
MSNHYEGEAEAGGATPVHSPLKTWHRQGWKPSRRPGGPSNLEAQVACKIPCELREARTHHHTFSHSHRSHHTHRTTLHRVWIPGKQGAPSVETNYGSFCQDLDVQLSLIDDTLAAVLVRSRAMSGAAMADSAAAAAAQDTSSIRIETMVARNAVNKSATNQMQFFTDCMCCWAQHGITCYVCPCKTSGEEVEAWHDGGVPQYRIKAWHEPLPAVP